MLGSGLIPSTLHIPHPTLQLWFYFPDTGRTMLAEKRKAKASGRSKNK